jgi:hypothetical protein
MGFNFRFLSSCFKVIIKNEKVFATFFALYYLLFFLSWLLSIKVVSIANKLNGNLSESQ